MNNKSVFNRRTASPSKSAFTLMEMIIALALTVLVISGFLYYVLSISDNRNKTYAIAEVQSNGRVALELISQRIRSASALNTASSTFNISPGVLSLSMASSTTNPTLINLTGANGRLQITEGALSAVPVTSKRVQVSNLVFTNLTSKGKRKDIMIDMTINYGNPGDVYYNASQTWETTVSLRQ